MKASVNITQWIKVGVIDEICFISKDVLCFGIDSYIVFRSLQNNEERVLEAKSRSRNGDGVAAVTGHRNLYIFAYAENCSSANIYVRAYPNFENISCLTGGSTNGYISLAFSETSQLIALGEFQFTITIWDWRTQEKFAHLEDSGVLLDKQLLRCSLGKPVNMAQLGRGSKKLCLWDLYSCCGRTILAKHMVKILQSSKIAPLNDSLWTSEGSCLVVDIQGNVYNINALYTLERVIEENINDKYDTFLSWYKGGIVVSGPNTEIRHYKKQNTWHCDWRISLPYGLKYLVCNKYDYLVGLTVFNNLVKISNTDGVTDLKKTESNINDVCLINPLGDYVIVLRHEKILDVYQIDTGQLVSTVEFPKPVESTKESPQYPYIAVGHDDGCVDLISFYEPEKPKELTSFCLCSKPIQKIEFCEHGMIMVAAYLDEGLFFIITGIPGTVLKVVAKVVANRTIVDFMLVASKNCYRLFAIPVKGNVWAGDTILRYCVMSNEEISVKEFVFESPDALYYKLLPRTDSDRDRIMYALSCKSRTIHVLETKRGDPTARVLSVIKTGHQLPKFYLHLTEYHAVTYGPDGFVVVRSSNLQRNIAWCITHHRNLDGVCKAFVDPLERYVVSLGTDSILVCTKLTETNYDEERRSALEALYNSPKFQLMFKRPTIGFSSEDRFKGMNWEMVEEMKRIEREEALCREARIAIWNEFLRIQSYLQRLVTYNFGAPKIEQLDMVEFYLDSSTYRRKLNQNKEACRKLDVYLRAKIEAQGKVSKYLINNFLTTMAVEGRRLKGIFSPTAVSNYIFLFPDQQHAHDIKWIDELRKVEEVIMKDDSYEPWRDISTESLLIRMAEPVKLPHDHHNAELNLDDWTKLSVESQLFVIGTSSMLHIERNPAHYCQKSMVTFYQCDVEQLICEDDTRRLKEKFNDVFRASMDSKQKKVDTIKQKNAKLRHMLSEYNHFSKDKVYIDIVDPEWDQTELPWLIKQVSDDELTVTPYISPSEQTLLDAKAAEEERIRLALLLDDFRERALMKMMNGVLEVRWEDELRRDVPLPKCMLEKQPAQFNEEDLRAVRDYEEKVVFLNSERERYKKILEADFTKTAAIVRDTVGKFNEELRQTVDTKHCIESAVLQENLRVYRAHVTLNKRVSLYKKESENARIIKENESSIERLKKTVQEMHKQLEFCVSNLEAWQCKEKILDKAFKRDIQEMLPTIQEVAVKLYRKRPRTSLRQINSSALFFELAKCVASQDKSIALTPDCYEYLKALDQLDESVDPSIKLDPPIFDTICKHRRLRIDFELKLRGLQLRNTDGEATIELLNQRIQIKKQNIANLLTEIKNMNEDYLKTMHNREWQMVMCRGLVELPLTGDVNDFKNAVIITRNEIETVNDKIKKAGEKKIQTILQNVALHRGLLQVEWEHQHLRMQLNDIVEHIHDVKSVKLTREMMQYLSGKTNNIGSDFQKEAAFLTSCYESQLLQKLDKHKEILKRIGRVKKNNEALDDCINKTNMDIVVLNSERVEGLEENYKQLTNTRAATLMKRSQLVTQIQNNHQEILTLQTELELLRLKTYPTFKFKLINTE